MICESKVEVMVVIRSKQAFLAWSLISVLVSPAVISKTRLRKAAYKIPAYKRKRACEPLGTWPDWLARR